MFFSCICYINAVYFGNIGKHNYPYHRKPNKGNIRQAWFVWVNLTSAKCELRTDFSTFFTYQFVVDNILKPNIIRNENICSWTQNINLFQNKHNDSVWGPKASTFLVSLKQSYSICKIQDSGISFCKRTDFEVVIETTLWTNNILNKVLKGFCIMCDCRNYPNGVLMHCEI